MLQRLCAPRALGLSLALASLGSGCADDASRATSTPPVLVADASAPSPDAPVENATTPTPDPIALAPAPASLSSVIGRWYLDISGLRAVATFTWRGEDATLRATLAPESAPEGDAGDPVEVLGWGDDGALRLRQLTKRGDDADWYRVSVVDGVMTGRVAPRGGLDAEPEPTRYTAHVTGWNGTLFDQDLAPRTWDLVLDGRERATLRVDRSPGGATAFAGTLKVYASTARGIADEQLEHDLSVLQWDGTNLVFFIQEGDVQRYYSGTVSGRYLTGYFLKPNDAIRYPFTGARRDVLGYGLAARTPMERAAWQARTRRQVAHLVMADAPAPRTTSVSVVAGDLMPIPEGPANPTRDDAMAAFPQRYGLQEIRFAHTLPNPYGGAALTRAAHAYVARPKDPPPASGYPIAIAVNGHWGSALQVMTPNSPYWYGDAFARRGYLVVAVDVSHRPLPDRRSLYSDLENGDDPTAGNGTHPAVRAPGMDSDWEEDGERAWDVMRALDYALAQPNVDPTRVVLVGLSMGGEVVTLAGALDPRVTAVVPTGFSPDVAVYQYRHHGCWDWAHADVNEYIDVSDYHALVAPRALVVETGTEDITYSIFAEPFASDKQVLRRSRAAFADVPGSVMHFLHDGAHSFQVGGMRLDAMPEKGVTVPLVVAPDAPWSLAWQSDERTRRVAPTLFDSLDAFAR